ncbi:MAG: nucleotide exchange factor GrpE [Candidatus Wildermuthbacteria bacterium]|nr:nucleotide exchange factor GrpE [Candidatus Wildermuthbacteria bacterium]
MEEEKEPKIEELPKKIEECEKLKDEYLAGWQRARADFLNYKKEEMERIQELVGYANEELVLKILPILDNFEVAEKCLTCDKEKDKNVKGLLMMKSQLQEFLKERGLEEVRAIGEKFDPNLHEAAEVGSDPTMAADGKKIEAGTIVEEIQKGYKINGRLLRPAKVKVVK